jgi:hypothetical protein
MTRKVLPALALGAALLPATASAQTLPSLPGGPTVLPFEPVLKPGPGVPEPRFELTDCRTYWVMSKEPPHKYEQQTVCLGFRIIP